MSNSRNTTNKILELIEEGILDPETVALACMKYMSEDDVTDMARLNDFIDDEDDEDDEEDEYVQLEIDGINEFDQDF